MIKLSKLANKVTGIVCRDSTFKDLMKTYLSLAIAFDKEYNDNVVVSSIVDFVEDKIALTF